MNTISAQQIRQFLISSYSAQISAAGVDPANVPDTFDFLLQGAIDSLGVLEMISAIEKEFGIEIDMSELDADKMTILGPLSEYVANRAASKNAGKY